MKRTVGMVMVFILISKVTGFMREVAIAGTFGASFLADVYKSSLIVPGMVASLFTVGLNAALIPVLSSAEQRNQREEFFRNFLSVITVLSVGAFLIIVLFAGPLTKIFVPGFDADKLSMTVKYTRIIAIIAPVQVLSYTIIAWLQQRERFYIAAFVAIPMNLIIIAGALLNKTGDLSVIALATVMGYLAQLIWVFYPYWKSKPTFNLRPTLNDPYLRMFWVMIIPILLTMAAGQINVLVDIALASGLGDGIVANMDYANKVNMMFQSVLVLSLSSVLFTKQSKLSSEEDRAELFLITKNNLSVLLMIMIPVALGTIFLSKEIMTILFVRGRYTLEAAAIGGGILFFYAPTIITRAVMEIFGKLYFALHKPKKAMLPTFVMIGTNIILNYIFVRFWGANGLALATSIGSAIGMLIMAMQVRGMFHQEKISLTNQSMLKFVIAGGVMFIALYILRWITPFGALSAIPMALLAAVIGAGIYIAVLYYLKTDELFEIRDQIRERIRRGNR